MTNPFERMLADKDVLLADGATGTSFFGMGLQSGDAPELWNVDYPERVAQHYQSFVDAGSDLILTNTFGGTRYRLMLHQAQDRVRELNIAAASILREVAAESERDIIVAGSVGPTGEILAPLGDLQPEDAIAAFAEQALALEQGGADVIWIETMSSQEEVEYAVAGARETADRVHDELRHQRPHHDGGWRLRHDGPAPTPGSTCLRHQLRYRRVGGSRGDPELPGQRG
jgi:5-methyltetrahydrofolate--homocysteine methyltransferase